MTVFHLWPEVKQNNDEKLTDYILAAAEIRFVGTLGDHPGSFLFFGTWQVAVIPSSMQRPGVTTARFLNTYILIMAYKSIAARDIIQVDQRTKAKTMAVSPWLVQLPISRRAVFRR